MKLSIQITLIFLTAFSCKAQTFTKEGIGLFRHYYNPSLGAFYPTRTFMINKENCVGDFRCKDRKKYKRIEFDINGIKMYKKNVRYNKDSDYAPIYYASNDQLYFANLEDERVYQPTFWDNGLLYNVTVLDTTNANISRFIVNDRDGYRLVDVSLPIKGSTEFTRDSVYGEINTNSFSYGSIAAKATTPSYYPLAFKDTYFGFLDVGEYYSRFHNANFIGYLMPAKIYYGNGTVVYMEDYLNKTFYWAVIIDGKIRFKLPATKAERPNVMSLKGNTDFDMIAINRNRNLSSNSVRGLYKKDETGTFRIKHSYVGDPLVRIRSKNIKVMNGYGVNLNYTNQKFPGDRVYLEIGNFKNGVLDGVGYRCNMSFQTLLKPYYDLVIVSNDIVDVDAEYGVFANGKGVNTKIIKAKNAIVDGDFWDGEIIRGVSYTNKYKDDNVTLSLFSSLKISDLKRNDEVYIKAVNRVFKVREIDVAKGILKTTTDDPAILAEFDKNFKGGLLFVKRLMNTTEDKKCPPTIKIPTYKTVKQFGYYVPGKSTSNTHTVKGVYSDKVVTTRSSTGGYNVYNDVQVVDFYTTKTCDLCNGTGVLTSSKMKNMFLRLDFE